MAGAADCLQNPSDERIAFKVKTTAPQSYSVKPAARVLEPGATCQLAVTMAALSPKKLPESVAECKDRFLVEAMVVGREVTEATSLLFKANPKAVRQAPPVLRQPD
ncbi:hypothetical protein CHLNCDRAFT_144513 [Chlorella variabilis]|uniref:MSP domain-containing protein n=1 Tax=Chlorella variabilis TaxID=554065 RepID=E1ZBL1_CHLVA|nr:hypothetical protein CHLNCDRAFT_144513 [Chlorella variabilis]EFN56663.1 hypothetical protein CHLNCDRAFT_144513 [Chlorella variabilis]|eukprot:XP_005848765.1 hypothetical protein CHLNCDRAFT_144513 [Chlorella variabilis]